MHPSFLDVWRKRIPWALGQLFAVLGLMVLLILPIAGYEVAVFFKTAVAPSSQKNLYIKPASSLRSIANQLEKQGVITSAFLLRVCAYTFHRGVGLKAGEYAFDRPMSPQQVLDKLRRGEVLVHSFKIIEGLESAIILEVFQRENALEGSIALADIPEGSTLPETYHFQRPETKRRLLARIQNAGKEFLTKLWQKRPSDSPFTSPQEVLILASLVERETPLPHERPRVAAVFLNRLKIGMPLQCDATVRYGLWQKRGQPLAGPLTRKDLQEDTPFNSYLHRGLPPTPICHPGRASLEAVMKPAKTDDLYFVADGRGGHIFSKTYAQHKIHHQTWRNHNTE